jgi:hypothetical protein
VNFKGKSNEFVQQEINELQKVLVEIGMFHESLDEFFKNYIKKR